MDAYRQENGSNQKIVDINEFKSNWIKARILCDHCFYEWLGEMQEIYLDNFIQCPNCGQYRGGAIEVPVTLDGIPLWKIVPEECDEH